MNIGIIGAGTIASGHIGGLNDISDKATIVAICDVNEETAREQAGKIDGEVSIYTDHKEMLKKEKLDIALVCLPHFLHCPVGLDVLNNGIHLFLEKPMANTVAECRQLLVAAEENGKQLFVGQTHQYRSILIKAKELIRDGAIGEPKMIYDEIVAYYNWEKRKAWFLDPVKAGGGALFNTSPHQADHLLYLIESPVKKVRASVQSLRPGQAIDSDTIAFIEYENGVQGYFGVFSGTKIANPATLMVRVLGTKGTIQFNPFGNEIELSKLDTVETIQCPPNPSPMMDEWIEFISAINENRPARTDGGYGLRVVALLEAMVESSKQKLEVTLP